MNLARRSRFLILLALMSLPCAADARGQTLERLREDYARRFMEPEPHMALAKYFRDSGNRLQAFYILETARRGRFEREEFDAAFREHFLGLKPLDKSPAAEAKLLAELKLNPDSHETLVALADIHISREEWAKAKEYLGKLVARHPEHFEDAQALAEVLDREGDEAEAQRILRDWARSHPETAEAYRVRAAEFSEDAAKAKPILTEAMKKFPRDASFPFALAGFLAQEGKLKEAEALYVRAAELAPDAPQVQAWAGRFFFRVAPDDRRALEYYLNAYLLDPHAYETEFVESRIPKIHERLAAAAFRDQLKRGVPLTKLATDADPFVAGLALDEMSKRWSPAYTETLVADMAHDDGGVRWQAMELLKGKAGASFDATLRALLEDKDLRRRGLAAYLAVHRWKAASFDHLRRMLGDDAQLLRFDAVSALVMEGGPEGSRLVLEHAAREPNARLKSLIEKTLARQPSR